VVRLSAVRVLWRLDRLLAGTRGRARLRKGGVAGKV
jgi:hypothetical protein